VFGLGALLDELLLAGDEPGGSRAGDDEMRHLVHTCLLEDPALRHSSAAAVLAALDRLT
jgi:hypothetical protein